MPQTNFADRLCQAVAQKRSHLAIGIAPVLSRIPAYMRGAAAVRHGMTARGAAAALADFSRLVIDAVQSQAAVVMPQSAAYEVYGHWGVEAFWQTVAYARSKGLLVIADAKRGDVGPHAEAYAAAFFGHPNPLQTWEDPDQWADGLTINPYMGSDAILPFVDRCRQRGTGLFVLVKSGNPTAVELQEQELFSGENVAQQVAKLVDYLGEPLVGESGYSALGAGVAGDPEQLAGLRQEMPKAILLVSGYGAEGGVKADVVHAFNADGLGALVSASHSITYAYAQNNPSEQQAIGAIQAAAETANREINRALAVAGRLAWQEHGPSA